MKAKSLISLLNQTDDESEVVCGVNNGIVETYGIVDYIFEDLFDNTIYNDLYGTNGKIDNRLMTKDMINKKIIYIGSDFPNKHVIENNNINNNIQKINDDPNYLWKINGFKFFDDKDCIEFWHYIKEFSETDKDGNFEYEMINYYKNNDEDFYTCELHCRRDLELPAKVLYIYNPTLEDIRNSMKLLGFEKYLIV